MRIYLVLSVLILSLVQGCSVNPVTGENQFTLMSASQEVAIGQKQYKPSQQAQGGRYITDTDLNIYVNGIGQKLAAVSHRSKLPFEFVVVNNGSANAWALPGGKIAVNRGLLLLLDDEAQLAAVLGHEITHVTARHAAQQSTRSTLLGLGTQVVGMATQNSAYGQLATMGVGLGSAMFQARYGRSQELEADNYGIDYMVKTGYDPMAAVELQEIFLKLSKGRRSGLLDSHPPSQERIDANRAKASQLLRGTRNRSSYQRAIAKLKRDAPAYAHYDNAIKAANDKQYDQALSLAGKAISLQKNEVLFWTLKGQLLAKQKRNSDAVKAFTSAINTNPEYYSPHLYRGLSYKELNNNSAAERDLLASLKLLPTQPAVYFLGELALKKGDTQQATRYFQQAAQGGGELGKAAQQKLDKLNPPAAKTAA